MKKITLLLITLLMLTCFASADYTLKKTINGVSVSTTVPEGRNVILKYLQDTDIFVKWLVKSGSLTLTNQEDTTVTFTMPAYDVEIQAVLTTDHTHSYSDATCTTPPTCSCGETSGEALGHSFTDATCTTAKTCSRCGTTEGSALGHSFVDATCTTAKTCSRCGTTEGSALGHSYTGTRTCNLNNSTDTVQCIRCSATESQACTHTYTISKGTETNGTITLSATSVKGGGSATATITPASGYIISSIAVNGSSVTVSDKTGMTYTFSKVSTNQTITVVFAEKPVIIANANVPAGAYIRYVPESTSVQAADSLTGVTTTEGYQEFNPSNTTLWRVMQTDGSCIYITSADIVLTTAGEGLSLKGSTGYNNVELLLDSLSQAFVRTGFVDGVGTRHVGSSAESAVANQYVTDLQTIIDVGIATVSDTYWLPYTSSTGNSFAGYAYSITYAKTDGTYTTWRSHSVKGGLAGSMYSDATYTTAMGIRPIVALDSTIIEIIDGDGTETNPYIIRGMP